MILFEDKKTEAESTSSGGVTENGSLATPINSASIGRVSHDGDGVKGEKTGDTQNRPLC